jgi:protease-4
LALERYRDNLRTVTVLFDEKLGNNNGITWDSVKTSQYADQQTISRPKSPQELAVYQRSVDRIYNLFLEKVSQLLV